MAVIIHEFVHHAVSEEDMTPQPYNTRSKLWRVLMPPDQLNPSGCIDAALESFMPMQVCACQGAGVGVSVWEDTMEASVHKADVTHE